MRKVLFICATNSALSQMAEGLFRDLCGGAFDCHSAGLTALPMDLSVAKVMSKIQIDISKQRSKGVDEYKDSGAEFAFLVKLCEEVKQAELPPLLRRGRVIEWHFPDPCGLAGSAESKLQRFRDVRDAMRLMLVTWCAEVCR